MKNICVLVLLFSLVVFTPVLAQNKNDDTAVTMGEVVVTATRDKMEMRKIPANVTTITAREIELSGATTLVEVLDKLTSLQFHDFSGNGTQAFIDMRGIGGDNPYGKTLILQDGRRLNNVDMRSINWLQIPLNIIDRIEVVRGAGCVLYGDAAIGGVINIITKQGKGKPRFNAALIAGSNGLHDERFGLTGSADKWSYAVTSENNFSFGYRDRSKSSSQGGGFDIGYDASEYFRISLGASFNQNDYQLPGALTRQQMEQDRRQYQPAGLLGPAHDNDDEKDRFTNVTLKIESVLGEYGRFDMGFLYGNKEAKVNIDSFASWANRSTDTYTISPKYTLEKDILGHANKLTLGLDYYNEPYKLDLFTSRERTSVRSMADFTKDSLGSYLRDEFYLQKSLILSIGYRTERTTIKGSNSDFLMPGNNFASLGKTYDADAYEAGLTWLFGKKSKIFTKYASVYRIPFLDEVASFNGWNAGTLFNTDLEKEKGISVEAGTEFYIFDNLKTGLTAFRIDMKDEISWFTSGPFTGFNRNQDKTRHDGAEISLSYLWPKYARIYGNFTYHLATFENGANNKKEVPLVPNRMANAGVEIYLPYNLILRPEIRYVSDAFLSGDNDNNAEKLTAYTLLNLYLSYKAPWEKTSVTAFIGLENLTDIKYSSFGIDYTQYGMPNFYYPMPGINVKMGASLEF